MPALLCLNPFVQCSTVVAPAHDASSDAMKNQCSRFESHCRRFSPIREVQTQNLDSPLRLFLRTVSGPESQTEQQWCEQDVTINQISSEFYVTRLDKRGTSKSVQDFFLGQTADFPCDTV